LRRSPLVLLPPGSKELVEGIAVAPDGSKVAAVLEPNVVAAIGVTSLGGHGTETRQLLELSAMGSVTKVLASNSVKYSGLKQEGLISANCQVFAQTPSGALARRGGPQTWAQARLRTSRRICSISSKSCCVQVSGGDS
jgi:hypothetical protein